MRLFDFGSRPMASHGPHHPSRSDVELRHSRTSRSGAQSMASCLPRSQLVTAAAVARCWIPMEPPCPQPCVGHLCLSYIADVNASHCQTWNRLPPGLSFFYDA